MRNSNTYIAIPPGETIKEQLEIRSITQKEFSKRMGMSEKHISKLINGEVQLTIDMAKKLEMVLNVSAQFWCNLESIYREDLLKVEEENSIDQELQILNTYPYEEMVQLGWIKNSHNPLDQVYELRKFFEVANLTYINPLLIPDIYNKNNHSLIALAQKAKLDSRSLTIKPLNIKKLKKILPQLSTLSKDNLIHTLSNCGVALIYLPKLSQITDDYLIFKQDKKIVVTLPHESGHATTLIHALNQIIERYC